MRLATRGCAMLGLAATLLLAGCNNFFVCQKASCPTSTTTGSTTTDYAYVSNSSSGSTYISAYDISGGTLAAISGSPYNIDYVPVAMTVSPNDDFLYIASESTASNPGIYVYSIGSGGVLTIQNGGSVDITDAISSMDISPDGGYLFTINTLGTLLTEYQINSSTGLLSEVASFQLPGIICSLAGSPLSQTCSVKAAPSGEFVVAALGTAGDAIFPFNSSSGITSATYTLISPASSTTGDYSVTLDDNNYVYVARTAALAVYSLSSTGIPTLDSTATYSDTATTPRSVVLGTSQNYVYTANEGVGTISAFGISSGVLSQISGSPFAGPTSVSALGIDKSGTYMVAAGYNSSSGVQLFTIGTSGGLTLAASAGSGTSTSTVPAILALTH